MKKGWTQWNVSLWIANDEDLYGSARVFRKEAKSTKEAAWEFFHWLADRGVHATPDGARYSVTNIRKAITELEL